MEAASYLNPQFGDDQLERVRTQEDLPHRASILAGYELPLFKGSRGIKRAIFGGWQAQLIALFQSGRQLGAVERLLDRGEPVHCGSEDAGRLLLQRLHDQHGGRAPELRYGRPAGRVDPAAERHAEGGRHTLAADS